MRTLKSSLVMIPILSGLVGGITALAVLTSLAESTTPKVEFVRGSEFELMEGAGTKNEDGLIVRSLGISGLAVVGVSLRGMPASDYHSVRFEVKRLEDASGAGVHWIRSDATSTSYVHPLTLDAVQRGVVEMDTNQDWRGNLQWVGLVIQGPLRGTVEFKSLSFERRPITLGDTVARLWRNGISEADWTPQSSNFYYGAASGEREVTAVSFAWLWMIFSLGSYILAVQIALRKSVAPRLSVSAVGVGFAAIAWVVLDIKWQIELGNRSRLESGAEFARFEIARGDYWKDLVRRVPRDNQTRVFIVTDQPGSWAALRTRYHLAGQATSEPMSRLPNDRERREGDWIVFPDSVNRFQFDQAAGELSFAEDRVMVSPVALMGRYGSVFRVLRESESP